MDKEFPELATERLTLREPSISDAPRFHEILSLPEVSKFSNIPDSPTLKRSEGFVGWMTKLFAKGNGCGWLIAEKGSSKIIGAIRINAMHKKPSFGQIGYELDPSYWNQGLMSEAVRAVTDFGHTGFGLNRMEAWVIPGNIGSELVLKKNGYQFEGTLRQRLNLRGELTDINMYSHLISDR